MRVKTNEPTVLQLFPASDPAGVERISGNPPVCVKSFPSRLGELSTKMCAYIISAVLRLMLPDPRDHRDAFHKLTFMCDQRGVNVKQEHCPPGIDPYFIVELAKRKGSEPIFYFSQDKHPAFRSQRQVDINTLIARDLHAFCSSVVVWYVKNRSDLFGSDETTFKRQEKTFVSILHMVHEFLSEEG